jgi:hypothetical protein
MGSVCECLPTASQSGRRGLPLDEQQTGALLPQLQHGTVADYGAECDVKLDDKLRRPRL